ncbi:MAG: MFS transporter [Planctomycetota bacterium]
MCLLYFAQGFPYGFATIALLAKLSEAGHPKEATSGLVAMVILPWTFKFIWAPMIDALRLPAFGIRRPWILFAQFGMAATLLGVWSTGDLGRDTTLAYLKWVFFIHNCFASLQDVATDALAVDLLEDGERGRVNGFMWGSKLAGIGVGGAGLGTLMSSYGIETAVLLQALTVIAIMGLVVALRERAGERLTPWSRGADATLVVAQRLLPGGMIGVVRELKRALSTRTTALAVLMAMTVPLCEGLYVPLTTDLFVQDFGWTSQKFSQREGTWGTLGQLCGALLGGVLCDFLGRRRMAGCGMVLTSLVLLTFGLSSEYWRHENYPQTLLLPLFKGSFAFTTVCLFSLYMNISWTRAAATQFTLYMAMNNLGHATGAWLNRLNNWSLLNDVQFAHSDFYVLAGFLAIVPLTVLVFLRPETIVARRMAENVASGSSPTG